MGFTRDPYLSVDLGNMWINVGEQQFHLPTRGIQMIPGHIGVVTPSLDALDSRLKAIEPRLHGTEFAWAHEGDHVAVTCPWGNHFRCYEPSERFGDMRLGLPYVEFLTPRGAAAGIARFYDQVFGAPSTVESGNGADSALISIGRNQWLRFAETDDEIRPYDGHHIAVYVANFSRPYAFLAGHELVTEPVANHQLRFQDILDPDSGQHLFTLEHEVRSLRHLMYQRPMVNRDPTQTQRSYVRGRDGFI
jgi:hypothetical protein